MKIHYKELEQSILDIKIDKRTEVFNFGIDNAFPSLIEILFRISVTSKACLDRVSKAIYGGSFGDVGKVIVNSKKQSLNEVLRISSRWYAKHNNCYLQVSYDGNFDIKGITVLPVTDVRIGKADDKGYSGKFIVYNNWDKSKKKKIESSGFIICDKFNSDKDIIKGQVKKAAAKKGIDIDEDLTGALAAYNGQIIHIKKDETFQYSISDLEPCMPEALVESNSQTFRVSGSEDGFINTKLMVVPSFKDEDERKDFKKDMKNLRGVKNANKVLMLETSQPSEDVSKQVALLDLSSTYNDKLFEYSDVMAEKNICKALGVLKILIDPTADGGSLGDTGGKLFEAKVQLWESREEDRGQFEEVFSLLMKNFNDEKKIEDGVVIIDPYDLDEDAEDAKNINKKAQANLRGSAGGVTVLAGLITSVSRGEVTKESAVAIVKGIYGFTEKKAKEMIGGFEEEEKV